jgi:DNA-binding NarL/FixJ family response regulator
MIATTGRVAIASARVVIADDHPLFRLALRQVIDRVLPGASYREVAGYRELLALVEDGESFDVVFVDLSMPGAGTGDTSALQALRERIPRTPLVVVSSCEDRATIDRALQHGIAAYVPKSASHAAMEAAIRAACNVPAAPAARETLTPRQFAVLGQLARGSSNRQIAAQLGIEEITVKAHVSAIFRKLNVKNRLQAVVASRAAMEPLAESLVDDGP